MEISKEKKHNCNLNYNVDMSIHLLGLHIEIILVFRDKDLIKMKLQLFYSPKLFLIKKCDQPEVYESN